MPSLLSEPTVNPTIRLTAAKEWVLLAWLDGDIKTWQNKDNQMHSDYMMPVTRSESTVTPAPGTKQSSPLFHNMIG
jgi:hypothetical protein